MSSRFILLVLAFVVSVGCGADLPSVIHDEMATTSRVHPNAATIVFFTDFQCPYCRRTHGALLPVLDAHRDRVRVVLRHVPLPSHPDARTAARAAVCVERLASPISADYAHALFESRDLSEAACEALSVERGVDRERFRACVSEPSTDAQIEQDIAMYRAVKGDGVPLLYVGSTRLDGAQSQRSLEVALEDALSRN